MTPHFFFPFVNAYVFERIELAFRVTSCIILRNTVRKKSTCICSAPPSQVDEIPPVFW